jgi:hypothetical protein
MDERENEWVLFLDLVERDLQALDEARIIERDPDQIDRLQLYLLYIVYFESPAFDSFPTHDGWPVELADLVRPVLYRALGNRQTDWAPEQLREVLPRGWGDLLRTARVLRTEQTPFPDASETVDAVALMETGPLFDSEEAPPGSLLAALQGVHLDNHPPVGQASGNTWHLHPLDKRGRHLRYKLLFDQNRRQVDLSWENHGAERLGHPWGDPAEVVLVDGTAESVYSGALSAVQKHSRVALKNEKFEVWSKVFEPVGRTAYVAHPPVTVSTKW